MVTYLLLRIVTTLLLKSHHTTLCANKSEIAQCIPSYLWQKDILGSLFLFYSTFNHQCSIWASTGGSEPEAARVGWGSSMQGHSPHLPEQRCSSAPPPRGSPASSVQLSHSKWGQVTLPSRDGDGLCSDKSMCLAQTQPKMPTFLVLCNAQRVFCGIPEGHCSY